MLPNAKTLNNPVASIREKNEILTYLRSLIDANSVSSTRYGFSEVRQQEDNRYLVVQVDYNIQPYSIFPIRILSPSESGNEFYQPIATVLGVTTKNEDVDKYRYVYATNDSGEASFSSDSSSLSSLSSSSSSATATLQCYIIGTHRPHLIRYSDSGPHTVGQRMGFVNDGSMTIAADPEGIFTCVSCSDNERKLVWIVAHHDQIDYSPWVQTTVNSSFSSYPSFGNTFVVRRMYFGSSSSFEPIVPEEYYIALSLCGFLTENTLTRMSRDRGLWYLYRLCKSSSSSSLVSSSSSASPASSTSPVSSSSSAFSCTSFICNWQWNGFSWSYAAIQPDSSICFPGGVAPFCRCIAPVGSGSFVGEIRPTTCFTPP